MHFSDIISGVNCLPHPHTFRNLFFHDQKYTIDLTGLKYLKLTYKKPYQILIFELLKKLKFWGPSNLHFLYKLSVCRGIVWYHFQSWLWDGKNAHGLEGQIFFLYFVLPDLVPGTKKMECRTRNPGMKELMKIVLTSLEMHLNILIKFTTREQQIDLTLCRGTYFSK